jgi:glycerol kinase
MIDFKLRDLQPCSGKVENNSGDIVVGQFLLALDQGTSSSRAIVYEVDTDHPDGPSIRKAGLAQEEIDMSFPADGWVEQDPQTLWQSTLRAGRRVLAEMGLTGADIAGIGITNQRETTIAWHRDTGKAVYPAIVWQDRRTSQRCEAMAGDNIHGQAASEFIAARTGLVIDPYFSSTKLAWILEQVEGARALADAGKLCFGTVDSFLVWHLTQGRVHATDVTNASRTQLFDIHDLQWSRDLLEYFAIPDGVLPQVVDSAQLIGTADPQWFGAAIPITGIAGDQQAAMIGQGCIRQGMSKSTYGTGCFVMTHTGERPAASRQNLLTTIGYRVHGKTAYALEGSIFVAGVAVKWLRDKLQLIADAAETEAAYQRTAGNSGGVYVVSAFTGLGAPYWVPEARGLICGLTLDTDRDQLLTAFLQSVGFQTEELLRAMRSDGAAVSELRIDGGMVVNNSLCQFLADILQVSVARPMDVETTALGAAMLASVGAELFADLESAAQVWGLDQAFSPNIAKAHREVLLQGYADAVRRALLVGT